MATLPATLRSTRRAPSHILCGRLHARGDVEGTWRVARYGHRHARPVSLYGRDALLRADEQIAPDRVVHSPVLRQEGGVPRTHSHAGDGVLMADLLPSSRRHPAPLRSKRRSGPEPSIGTAVSDRLIEQRSGPAIGAAA